MRRDEAGWLRLSHTLAAPHLKNAAKIGLPGRVVRPAVADLWGGEWGGRGRRGHKCSICREPSAKRRRVGAAKHWARSQRCERCEGQVSGGSGRLGRSAAVRVAQGKVDG